MSVNLEIQVSPYAEGWTTSIYDRETGYVRTGYARTLRSAKRWVRKEIRRLEKWRNSDVGWRLDYATGEPGEE